MKVVGFAGWSGSGKTRLIVALVKEFSKKGLLVSTMKHAHHTFDIDQKGKDSFEHRQAGAHEVLVVSEKRWALMHEYTTQEKASMARSLSPAVLLPHLAPVDVLLVEGFKTAPLDKIEVHRARVHREKAQPLLSTQDKNIRAIVSDEPASLSSDLPLPVFDADEPSRIADFVLKNDAFFNTPQVDSLADSLADSRATSRATSLATSRATQR